MRVSDLRAFDKQALVTVDGAATVRDAVKTMAEKAIGAILIVEAGKVTGIFTERDLMTKVVSKELDPSSTRIADVMTGSPKTARANDAAIDSLELMASGGFRHLPVVDDDGHPIGIVSQRDFVATTLPQALSLARQTAQATVAKRYQPVTIIASIVAYTLVIALAVSIFT